VNNFDKFDEIIIRALMVIMCLAGLLALAMIGVLLFRAFSGV